MLKYYCDICGREIKNDDNVIEVNIARKLKALETDEVGACYEYDHRCICFDCETKFMNIFRKEE